jgi:hypothetical protein
VEDVIIMGALELEVADVVWETVKRCSRRRLTLIRSAVIGPASLTGCASVGS